MIWFGYVLVWFGMVWFRIIWCAWSLSKICYHAKSGACGFKNFLVTPILVLFGMVWFGLVMFWFCLVSFLIIWCMPIIQICYHAKSVACNFKNDQVISILVLLGLVWFGMVWRFHEGAVMLPWGPMRYPWGVIKFPWVDTCVA